MTISYNGNAWLQERTLIKVSGITDGNQVKLELEIEGQPVLSQLVSYYDVDAMGSVTIDVTDLLRIAYRATGGGLRAFLTEWNGAEVGTTQSASFSVKGFINPAQWIKPAHPNDVGYNNMYISVEQPPTMILQPIEGIGSQYSIYNTTDCPNTPDYYVRYGFGESENIRSLNNILRLSNTHSYIEFFKVVYGSSTRQAAINIRPMLCDRKYAAIEWQSRRGVSKRATWEVRSVVENTLDPIELQTDDNSYNVCKGKKITATLYLDNLTAYDVWYYADIVTSGRVTMQLDSTDTPTQIEVTTKKIEIPDGDNGKFYTLKVEINYKRYDTI